MKAYLEANPRGRPEIEFLSPRVFTSAMGWVDWARTRQPFALVVDSFDAHEPWDVPKRLSDMYGSPDGSGVEPIQPFPTPAAKYAPLGLSQSMLHRMRELYAAEVTMVDTWLGKFLDHLANAGVLDNTLVVLVQRPRRAARRVRLGRQALHRGAHASSATCRSRSATRRGKAKGKTSRYWASHHDIGPTVLSVLGYDKPGSMNGTDLSPLLDGKQPAQKRTYRTAAYSTYVAARDDKWLLISDNRGREKRLYSLAHEGRNVTGRYPQHVRRLWGYIVKDAGPKGLPHFK